MALYAPAILDELSDLKLWLSEERDFAEMCDRLKSDIVLLRRIAHDIFTSSEDKDVDNLRPPGIQALELMLEKYPPRLFGTCDALADILKRKGVVAPALTATLQQHRKTILEEREHMKESLARPEPTLSHWTDP